MERYSKLFEKRTGPKIVISEWGMDATITNNKRTSINKMKVRLPMKSRATVMNKTNQNWM